MSALTTPLSLSLFLTERILPNLRPRELLCGAAWCAIMVDAVVY